MSKLECFARSCSLASNTAGECNMLASFLLLRIFNNGSLSAKYCPWMKMIEVEARRVRKLGFPSCFIRLFELEGQRSLSYEELVRNQEGTSVPGAETSIHITITAYMRWDSMQRMDYRLVNYFMHELHIHILHTYRYLLKGQYCNYVLTKKEWWTVSARRADVKSR